MQVLWTCSFVSHHHSLTKRTPTALRTLLFKNNNNPNNNPARSCAPSTAGSTFSRLALVIVGLYW